MHEAKTQLSRLVQRAAAGEDIIIAKAGEPLVRLVPYKEEPAPRRVGGAWAGQVWLADDWDSDETNAEIAATFYESKIFPDEETPGIENSPL